MTDVSANGQGLAAGTGSSPAGNPSGMMRTIAAVVVVTLVAAGGGALMGSTIGAPEPAAAPEAPEAPPASAAAVESPDAEAAGKGAGGQLRLIPLQPVVTNIYAPQNAWLRVEAAIVVGEGVENAELLAAQIQADTVAFLRTVQLAQIEGARGLLHLREDLRERAMLRSPAVTDYIIQSLVAE